MAEIKNLEISIKFEATHHRLQEQVWYPVPGEINFAQSAGILNLVNFHLVQQSLFFFILFRLFLLGRKLQRFVYLQWPFVHPRRAYQCLCLVYRFEVAESRIFYLQLVIQVVKAGWLLMWLAKSFQPLAPISFLCLKLDHIEYAQRLLISYLHIRQHDLPQRVIVFHTSHELLQALLLLEVAQRNLQRPQSLVLSQCCTQNSPCDMCQADVDQLEIDKAFRILDLCR